MSATVSVIMAACDVEDVVDDAIASIVAQRDVTWELVLVDDGSTDRTNEIAARWRDELGTRMRVHRSEHRRGAAHARNVAIADARGEFIAIADADDVSLPDRLARSVSVLRADPMIAAVGGQVDHFWSDRAPRRLWHFPVDAASIRAAVEAGRMPLAHPATTFRTAAVRAVGGYDERLLRAQDLDLVLRLASSYRLVGLEDTLVHYRRNPRLASPRAYVRNQLYAAYVRERHRSQAAGRPHADPESWLGSRRRNPAVMGWLTLRYLKQLAVPS